MPVALVLLASGLSGCLTTMDTYYGFDADQQYKNPGVFPGTYVIGGGSNVLRPGHLKPGDPEILQIWSDLPAYPGPLGSTSDAQVLITMAVWRPMNTTQRVPIIVDAGPYFEVFEQCATPGQDPCTSGYVRDTIATAGQTTPFNLRNFLPHGYAVAQVGVRGTGTQGGCMDLMGPAEMHDLGLAITHLATQPWSNGNVAMVGASYDGSTPWIVAATGNPHLKAIVPTSGLPDIFDLMFHNGSVETRGPFMHSSVYWGYGFSDEWPYSDLPGGTPHWPDEAPVPPPAPFPPMLGFPGPTPQANDRQPYQNLQNLLCPEVAEGLAVATQSTLTGWRAAEASSYWAERDHRQAVLDNYKGAVFLVHGLQDWNVDPHAAIPFNAALREAGIEVKEWYGQWHHAFPDSWCGPAPTPRWVTAPCRLDFAEVLLRFFDRHLKGNTTVDTGPAIQVQDNIGFWRNADSYPPANPDWLELRLAANGTLDRGSGGPESTVTLEPARDEAVRVLEFQSDPMPKDLHISGLPQLRLPFAAKGSGGEVGAYLFDADPDGRVRAPFAVMDDMTNRWLPVGVPVVGHAHMNLHYYEGGEEPQPLVPGQRQTARVEFEPLEVRIPEGHRVVLWVFQGGYPDRRATATPAPVDVYLGPDAVLRLPTLDVDPTTVFPVPGVHTPQRDLLPQMYVDMPGFVNRIAVFGACDQQVEAVPAPALAPDVDVPAAAPACGRE